MQVALHHANHGFIGSTLQAREGVIADGDIYARINEIHSWAMNKVSVSKMLDMLSRDPHTHKKIGIVDSRVKRKVRFR